MRKISWLAMMLLFAILVGCGGGGGSQSSNLPNDDPPITDPQPNEPELPVFSGNTSASNPEQPIDTVVIPDPVQPPVLPPDAPIVIPDPPVVDPELPPVLPPPGLTTSAKSMTVESGKYYVIEMEIGTPTDPEKFFVTEYANGTRNWKVQVLTGTLGAHQAIEILAPIGSANVYAIYAKPDSVPNGPNNEMLLVEVSKATRNFTVTNIGLGTATAAAMDPAENRFYLAYASGTGYANRVMTVSLDGEKINEKQLDQPLNISRLVVTDSVFIGGTISAAGTRDRVYISRRSKDLNSVYFEMQNRPFEEDADADFLNSFAVSATRICIGAQVGSPDPLNPNVVLYTLDLNGNNIYTKSFGSNLAAKFTPNSAGTVYGIFPNAISLFKMDPLGNVVGNIDLRQLGGAPSVMMLDGNNLIMASGNIPVVLDIREMFP